MIAPHTTAGLATLYHGDSLAVLAALEANSFGACITDPPYHLGENRPIQRGYPQREGGGAWTDKGRQRATAARGGFMGMAWDGGGIAYNVDLWRLVYRALKPGAYLAAFGGSRTYHRMAVAIEDAGFVIRDSLHWMYGSGFPKSHNIAKAIDKAAGARREKVRIAAGQARNQKATGGGQDGKAGAARPYIDRAQEAGYHEIDGEDAVTDLAKEWQGWGTALKPGHEPIVLAQKPYEGTYAANVARWGVGALNLDACRIWTPDTLRERKAGWQEGGYVGGEYSGEFRYAGNELGRWPSNVLLTHSLFCVPGVSCDPSCPIGQLDRQAGIRTSGKQGKDGPRGTRPPGSLFAGSGESGDPVPNGTIYGDSGGASRFFPALDWGEEDYWWHRYTPKPPKAERNAGLIDPDTGEGGNTHVTVKPLSVMGWLIDLTTPKGETLIDPFAGSGTTLCAARQRKRASVGIELEAEHCAIVVARLGANTIKAWEN